MKSQLSVSGAGFCQGDERVEAENKRGEMRDTQKREKQREKLKGSSQGQTLPGRGGTEDRSG